MAKLDEEYYGTSEIPDPKQENQRKLFRRQNEIADLIGVNPNILRGLVFCDVCEGSGQLVIETLGRIAISHGGVSVDEFQKDTENVTRNTACMECDGTGIKFGGLDLSAHEWIQLSLQNIEGINVRDWKIPYDTNKVPAVKDAGASREMNTLNQIRKIRKMGHPPRKPGRSRYEGLR